MNSKVKSRPDSTKKSRNLSFMSFNEHKSLWNVSTETTFFRSFGDHWEIWPNYIQQSFSNIRCVKREGKNNETLMKLLYPNANLKLLPAIYLKNGVVHYISTPRKWERSHIDIPFRIKQCADKLMLWHVTAIEMQTKDNDPRLMRRYITWGSLFVCPRAHKTSHIIWASSQSKCHRKCLDANNYHWHNPRLHYACLWCSDAMSRALCFIEGISFAFFGVIRKYNNVFATCFEQCYSIYDCFFMVQNILR